MQDLRTISLGALALLVLALPAAGRPLDADLAAIAYCPISPGAAFQVRTAEDSELAERVRDLVEAALKARRYAVADDAPLVLTIEIEADGPDGAAKGSLGRVSAGSGRGVEVRLKLWSTRINVRSGRDVEIRFNLWSSRGNSLLLATKQDPPGARTYRIAVAVHDRTTRRYVWRGSIGGVQDGTGARALSEAAVSILLDAIGQTVDNRTVWLR